MLYIFSLSFNYAYITLWMIQKDKLTCTLVCHWKHTIPWLLCAMVGQFNDPRDKTSATSSWSNPTFSAIAMASARLATTLPITMFTISFILVAAPGSEPTINRGTMGNEPRHDKTNKVSVRPAKTQISLGIRPVWSESSLSAWRTLGP